MSWCSRDLGGHRQQGPTAAAGLVAAESSPLLGLGADDWPGIPDGGNRQMRVTNVAKTAADCFKFRSLVGLDVAIEALREALPAWTSS